MASRSEPGSWAVRGGSGGKDREEVERHFRKMRRRDLWGAGIGACLGLLMITPAVGILVRSSKAESQRSRERIKVSRDRQDTRDELQWVILMLVGVAVGGAALCGWSTF